MNNQKLNKEKFMEIAGKILATDEELFVGTSESPDDKMYEKTGDKCKIVIRDFDNPRFDVMRETGVWDADDDKEFTEPDKAWQYYNSLSSGRLMDSSGSIIQDFGVDWQ